MKGEERESSSLNLLRYRKKELIKHRQYDNQREIIAETIRTTHGASAINKIGNDNNILKTNRITSHGVSRCTYLGVAVTGLLWASVCAAYCEIIEVKAYLPWIFAMYIFEAIYSGIFLSRCNMLNTSEFKQYIQSVRLTAPILELNARNMSKTSVLCKFSRWYDHTNVPMFKLGDSNIQIIQVILQESWHSLNVHTTDKIELQKTKYMNKYNKNNSKNITIDDVLITCRIEGLNDVYVCTNTLVSDYQGQQALLIRYKEVVYIVLSMVGLSILYRIWIDRITARVTLLIDKTVLIDK